MPLKMRIMTIMPAKRYETLSRLWLFCEKAKRKLINIKIPTIKLNQATEIFNGFIVL